MRQWADKLVVVGLVQSGLSRVVMSLLGVLVPGGSVCSEGETSQRALGAVRTKVKDGPSWRKVSEWICWIFEGTIRVDVGKCATNVKTILDALNFSPNHCTVGCVC